MHLPQVATAQAPPDVPRVHDVVDAARDLGLAAVCANDHLAFHLPWLDGPSLLAAVADRAGGLDLATTVALPSLRGPVPLAASLATLALLAPGRVVAGVGAGSSRVDHALAGVPFEDRWRRFDEAVAVLRSLLGGAAPLPDDWQERLAGALVVAPPVPVPVWVASWGSPAGLRRVARLGDGWLASAYNTTPADFAAARRDLAEACVRLGRTPLPAAVATMWLRVTDDDAETERVLRDVLAPIVRRDPDELRGRVCVGTPDHCVRLLSAYAAAGCVRMHVWPLEDEVAQLERLLRDVVPGIDHRPSAGLAPASGRALEQVGHPRHRVGAVVARGKGDRELSDRAGATDIAGDHAPDPDDRRQAGDDRDAEPGGDERLDGHVVVRHDADSRRESLRPTGVAHHPEPRAATGTTHPGLVAQVAQRRVAIGPRQSMALRQQDPVGVLEERDALQLRAQVALLRAREHHRDVELALAQPRQQSLHVVVDHGEREVRELGPQAGDGPGHERRQRRRHAAEPEPALLPAKDVEEVALGGVEPGDHGPRVGDQDVTGRGQADRPGGAVDEGRADLSFERRDVLADRRLGHPQLRCGTRERPGPLEGGQDLESRHGGYQRH